MHISNSPSKNTFSPPSTTAMQGALRFYPWNDLDLVRMLPREHWLHRRYQSPSRTATRDEPLMRYPPFGLRNDGDWHEEMQLLTCSQRRRIRRMVQGGLPPSLHNHCGAHYRDTLGCI
jgi:hypothetical protein